ncbi:MAG: hypothetical protein NE327_04385 [Lentisphaeraceae bacterium]|nr:hypothetical protein [Lentisphaeraceae bacterium]
MPTFDKLRNYATLTPRKNHRSSSAGPPVCVVYCLNSEPSEEKQPYLV